MKLPPQVALSKKFKLRFDFELEIGFVDFIRQPLTREEWDARVARMRSKGNEMILSYEEHLAAKKDAPIADRFSIFAYRPADSNMAVPIVTDYHDRLRVEYRGLFFDTVQRANAAMGLPPGAESVIMPSAFIPISKTPIYPTHFVMHDPTAEMGYILPWELYEAVLNPYGSP